MLKGKLFISNQIWEIPFPCTQIILKFAKHNRIVISNEIESLLQLISSDK